MSIRKKYFENRSTGECLAARNGFGAVSACLGVHRTQTPRQTDILNLNYNKIIRYIHT